MNTKEVARLAKLTKAEETEMAESLTYDDVLEYKLLLLAKNAELNKKKDDLSAEYATAKKNEIYRAFQTYTIVLNKVIEICTKRLQKEKNSLTIKRINRLKDLCKSEIESLKKMKETKQKKYTTEELLDFFNDELEDFVVPLGNSELIEYQEMINIYREDRKDLIDEAKLAVEKAQDKLKEHQRVYNQIRNLAGYFTLP
jgi:hypothetical protein